MRSQSLVKPPLAVCPEIRRATSGRALSSFLPRNVTSWVCLYQLSPSESRKYMHK